ncbi:UNKNOWN [Stylonychia lemnae]|uniref:Uncharacterized protein n=1 Tax=Stylonychia lemnae TaxID=5949 RepID=A0A078A549_STYLE|nr:UNKNOWN [Stylonychia lemnae]|eukprot:CDW75864.1 UNKNOWN [Stylonychia lemnae]
MENISVSSRTGDNLKPKNKEISLFGLFITHMRQTKEIEKKFKYFVFYLLNPDALQSSYKVRNFITGYVPSKYTFGLNEYEDKVPIKNDDTPLMNQELKRETQWEYLQEIRMYSDRVDNSHGATVKTCNRIQIKEDSSTFSRNFIKDTGYQIKYDYRLLGTVYKFVLNDFYDLKLLIPIIQGQQQQQYKKVNLLSKICGTDQSSLDESQMMNDSDQVISQDKKVDWLLLR